MRQIPTRSDLADLGTAIARSGLGPFESHVAAIAELALQLDPTSAAPSVLTDRSAPTVARLRSLAIVSAAWDHTRLVALLAPPARNTNLDRLQAA